MVGGWFWGGFSRFGGSWEGSALRSDDRSNLGSRVGCLGYLATLTLAKMPPKKGVSQLCRTCGQPRKGHPKGTCPNTPGKEQALQRVAAPVLAGEPEAAFAEGVPAPVQAGEAVSEPVAAPPPEAAVAEGAPAPVQAGEGVAEPVAAPPQEAAVAEPREAADKPWWDKSGWGLSWKGDHWSGWSGAAWQNYRRDWSSERGTKRKASEAPVPAPPPPTAPPPPPPPQATEATPAPTAPEAPPAPTAPKAVPAPEAGVEAAPSWGDYKQYYAVLGLEKGASHGAVRKAFNQKALLTHPDKVPGLELEFRAAQEAYETLKDPVRSKQYDVQCEHAAGGPKALPLGWEIAFSRSRPEVHYYFFRTRGHTQFDHPTA